MTDSATQVYDEGSREFYRPLPDYNCGVQRVTVNSPSGTNEDSGIRLYCTMFQQQWTLQVRGFHQTRNFKRGKRWFYANAPLGVDDVRALRDACNAALAEVGE